MSKPTRADLMVATYDGLPACPVCQANRGGPCFTPSSGRVRGPHKARVAAGRISVDPGVLMRHCVSASAEAERDACAKIADRVLRFCVTPEERETATTIRDLILARGRPKLAKDAAHD